MIKQDNQTPEKGSRYLAHSKIVLNINNSGSTTNNKNGYCTTGNYFVNTCLGISHSVHDKNVSLTTILVWQKQVKGTTRFYKKRYRVVSHK